VTLFRYSVSGLLVKSVLPLCGLCPTDDGFPPEYTVSQMDRATRDVQPEWPAGQSGPRDFIRKSGGESVFYWLRTGDAQALRIHPAAGLVEFDPDSSPGLALTHGIVDFALPNLLSCSDQIVFHGALLETEEGCVAALGESGVGKSTLAASWVRAGRRFLSDDWFVLRPEGERLLAYPSYPSIRLRSRDRELSSCGGVEEIDSQPGFSKIWYSFGPGSAAYCSEPRELRGVAFLRRGGNGTGKTRLASLGSREAVADLVSALVLLEIDSSERWEFLVPLLARVEADVRMEEVYLPEGTEYSADVVKAIERLAKGTDAF
jgi:hypothetical protein